MVKVIGAGLGRTGTHSLALALDTLGIAPCYHLPELAKNPEHIALWNRILDGENIDWNVLFNNYAATVEWPAVAFLPQLLNHYAQSKVILTVREPDSWYESARKTIFNALELSQYNPDPDQHKRGDLNRRLVLNHTFSDKYNDKALAINIYQQHNRHVIENVPPERLLIYNIKDGWEPLCRFLNKTIPAAPFPQANDSATFLATTPTWAKKYLSSERVREDAEL